jgi:molybdopterin-guanine dinucleotide biosynthesis protein A
MNRATRLPYPSKADITGVILAGGQARRLGGVDKGLLHFAGRPLVEWVIAALRPQVGTLLISANRNRERYADYGLAVIADLEPGFQGPLAGFHSAMQAARTDWIVTVPCDGPYPAPDLVERLVMALGDQGAELAVATDGTRMQPVHALLPVNLAASLRDFMAGGGRKVELWYERHRVAVADLSDRPDCFINFNAPGDAENLGRLG